MIYNVIYLDKRINVTLPIVYREGFKTIPLVKMMYKIPPGLFIHLNGPFPYVIYTF